MWYTFDRTIPKSLLILGPKSFVFVLNFLPSEIVFLKTTVPAYGSYHLGSYDVKFEILEGNIENAFDIIKRVENGVYVGE